MQPSDERVDDESKKFLADVKKGKPRKFVMIKDGTEIDRLYVFKKGPFDRYVRMAKKDSVRGEAFWGIVRGNGLDILFELSRSDGFNSPPGPAIKLKEFLKESTDFKFEPDYLIVDVPTAVDEDEATAVAAAAPADQAAPGDQAAPADEAATQAAPQEDAGEKFVRLLKSILPHVKRALATTTPLRDELQASVKEAQDLGRNRDFENGMTALRRVGALTKQALGDAGPAPAPNAADQKLSPREEAEAKRRRQWEERMAEIEPRFKQAVQSAVPDAGKLEIVMNYARRQSKLRKYVKALVGLDRLERMLAETAGA